MRQYLSIILIWYGQSGFMKKNDTIGLITLKSFTYNILLCQQNLPIFLFLKRLEFIAVMKPPGFVNKK